MPQNLIADWSAEEVVECPYGLGSMETFLPTWISLRGTPDYFNNCNPELGSNNPVGYQEPRTGEGYIGALTYFENLPEGREYIGAQLQSPLQIGESYFISFHASMAYTYDILGAAKRGSNNLGFLLMTTNYLDSEGQGIIPNFSHYHMDDIHIDTTNWVQISTTFIADSAYSLIAFGNFYDDENTEVIAPYDEEPAYGYPYYYLDDFCVAKDSISCYEVLAIPEHGTPKIYISPNPTFGILNFQSSSAVNRLVVRDVIGRKVIAKDDFQSYDGELNRTNFGKGVYFIYFETQKGMSIKRVVVQ